MQNDEVSEEAARRVEVWKGNNDTKQFMHRKASLHFPNKPSQHFPNYRSMEQWFNENKQLLKHRNK